MHFRRTVLATVITCLSSAALPPAGAEPAKPGLTNRFFALCVSTHDAKYRTPDDQAKLLKELGYAGNCHLWCEGVPEALAAVDQHGLELSQIYIRASVDPAKPKYDARLKDVIKLLKGRQTILGLLVGGGPPSAVEHDERAVEVIREIADMAEASGVRVALYPHLGDWLERVEDAVRVTKKVDRKNVGVTFNLCHWLIVDDEKNMRRVMQLAMPHLFVVTINGSSRDVTPASRDGWIQTLDRGSFDVGRFMATLNDLGYTGPVGLQCYGIRGDVRDNLKRSMEAWRGFSDRIAARHAVKPRLTDPFFAFDNGTGQGRIAPQEQARMLKELGYAGIGYTGAEGIAEMLRALDGHQLKMYSIYVGAQIGPDGPTYDPHLKEALRQLKGRHTIIWLTITGNAPGGDQQAVAVVREIARAAEQSGLRVALYPHVGFYVARVEDAVRVADKVDRENVGVSFNLCHWLQVGDEPNMVRRIRQAMPRMFVVSINGADHSGGWDRLIQTLDRGEFDVYRFLKILKTQGYEGPIGLQCYAIKGDVRENLERSMGAWRKFVARMAAAEE